MPHKTLQRHRSPALGRLWRMPEGDASPRWGTLVWLRRIVVVEPGEVAALLWSTLLFCLVLGSYYVVRPLRDTMGLVGGTRDLPWLFSATFVAMLVVVPVFSAVVARWPRQRFIPWVYNCLAVQLLGFYAALTWLPESMTVVVARVFFVWSAVFSLFVVSVFWEYMADVWRRDQGERLFGFIAAGGTVGALVGPVITGVLAPWWGPAPLLVVAAAGLVVAARCVGRLGRVVVPEVGSDRPMGGSIFAGFTLVVASPQLLAICGYIGFLALTGTVLYFIQMQVVEAAVSDAGQRTALFAAIDGAVTVMTLLLQVFIVGRVVRRVGLGWTLAALPMMSLVVFGFVAAAPILAVVVVAQVARRASDYAFAKPAREVLFTQVSREARYKAKSFIDTAVYRGGDALSAWAFRAVAGLGVGMPAIAVGMIPVAVVWAGLALGMGRRSRAAEDPQGVVDERSAADHR